MKLSEHLDLSEVIRSESAKRNGISNMPTEAHIANFKLLAEKVFEPIRNHFRCPIHISSGYRSLELNKCIGGAATGFGAGLLTATLTVGLAGTVAAPIPVAAGRSSSPIVGIAAGAASTLDGTASSTGTLAARNALPRPAP